jgi:hypothetical protein
VKKLAFYVVIAEWLQPVRIGERGMGPRKRRAGDPLLCLWFRFFQLLALSPGFLL